MYNFLSTIIGLTALQIVLNIDNVIFISVLTSKLENKLKIESRRYSLYISIIMNSILIFMAGYLSVLNNILFTLFDHSFTWKSLIMFLGGLFLIYKSSSEIYKNIEGRHNDVLKNISLKTILINLIFFNSIFSIDSAIVSVGMTDIRWVQLISSFVGVSVMYIFFNKINYFIEKHPSLKIQAISFLSLIGFSLFTDGLGMEIPKGYIYFAMFISFIFEIIQIQIEKVKQLKKK